MSARSYLHAWVAAPCLALPAAEHIASNQYKLVAMPEAKQKGAHQGLPLLCGGAHWLYGGGTAGGKASASGQVSESLLNYLNELACIFGLLLSWSRVPRQARGAGQDSQDGRYAGQLHIYIGVVVCLITYSQPRACVLP